MRDHEGKPTDGRGLREKLDYGKPGDPSGCYFPAEWRKSAKVRTSGENSTPTTCVETIDGDPDTALRLSFQIKVF